jgi:hypothetical protein
VRGKARAAPPVTSGDWEYNPDTGNLYLGVGGWTFCLGGEGEHWLYPHHLQVGVGGWAQIGASPPRRW